LAGCASRENLDALLDFCDGPDVKFSRGDGFQNVFAEHQVFYVGLRHHDALRAGESLDPADVKILRSFSLTPPMA